MYSLHLVFDLCKQFRESVETKHIRVYCIGIIFVDNLACAAAVLHQHQFAIIEGDQHTQVLGPEHSERKVAATKDDGILASGDQHFDEIVAGLPENKHVYVTKHDRDLQCTGHIRMIRIVLSLGEIREACGGHGDEGAEGRKLRKWTEIYSD